MEARHYINWGIQTLGIIVSAFLFIYNTVELKRSEKRQEKRIDDLWKRLLDEITEKKDSERKLVEENVERWKSLYSRANKEKDEYYERFKKLREETQELMEESRREKNSLKRENLNLRTQMVKEAGIPWDKHDINDEKKREEAIFSVEAYWEDNEGENGKINGLTIKECLGENWENTFDNRKGEEIIKWRDRLIKRIDDEIELTKKKRLS